MIHYLASYAWLYIFHPTFHRYPHTTRRAFMGSWRYLN
jgi:hypothetical protein